MDSEIALAASDSRSNAEIIIGDCPEFLGDNLENYLRLL
jgi:hypothetical protein